MSGTPPRIDTPWGPVSEPARLQAAKNMREEPALREKVMRVLALRLGINERAAWQEMRRRYPEAFAFDDTTGETEQ